MEDFWRKLSPFGLEVGAKLLEARNFGVHFFCGHDHTNFQINLHIFIQFTISSVKIFHKVFNFKI